jgi:hypothetical protein
MIVCKDNLQEEKMRKIVLCMISILLVSVIILTTFTSGFVSSKGTESLSIDLTSLKESNRNYYYATVAASLVDSFPTVVYQDVWGGKREVIAYPPEYAGAYIDENNTLHIVLTKDANMTTLNNYRAIMYNDKDIVYQYADFPLSRLYDAQRALDGVMQQFGMESTGANEATNKLEIRMINSAKEQGIIDFLDTKFNDFDVRCISFENATGLQFTDADTTSNALAGSYTSSSSNEWATLGFDAYRHPTGHTGVVTAGHYATAGTTIYNAVGTTIGSEEVRQYTSGTIDAAFIQFPPGITSSYKLSNSYAAPDDCITHYYPYTNYTQGQSVNKIGSNTSITSGTILNVGATATAGGFTFTDQVYISNQQKSGDSGGPVFETVVNTPGTDFHLLVGIATIGEITSPYRGYVSKVANIMSAFTITPFYGT